MKEIDMTRREGPKGVALVELASRRKQSYIVRTDLKPYKTDEADGVTFIEQRYDYKPTMDDIKEFVYGVINKHTDEKILSGFRWQGMNIWLSGEYQRNFAEAHRLVMADESVLPMTFKMGEDDLRNPVYHTFETFSELDDFYKSAFAYIKKCQEDGWSEKDLYDFREYERQLEELQ